MNHKDEVARLRAHIKVLEGQLLKQGTLPKKLKADYLNASEIIISIVCDVCKVTRKEIMSKDRPDYIAWPRHLIMYFCKKYKLGSYSRIAAIVGLTDHGAALYAYRKITETNWLPGIHKDQLEKCTTKIAEAIGNDDPCEIDFQI